MRHTLAGAFASIFNVVYLVVGLNILLALTCAPVWLLALFVPLKNSWLWLALSGVLLGPALAGAYAVFRAFKIDESVTIFKTYLTEWAHSWRRVWLPALCLSLCGLVIGLDVYVMWRWGHLALALPLAVVLVALGFATASVAWVGFAARPDLGWWAVVKASAYLAVRQPGWSLLTLIMLAVAAAAIWVSPLIGLGLVVTPVLYVVWSDSRRVFARFLPADEVPHEA